MPNIGGEALVALAKAIATFAHTGQKDKNRHDYIDHPKSVFYRVFADDEQDYDGQIVAWLHDVVEDTEVTFDDLRAFFPEYIVAAVEAITHYTKKGGFEFDEERDDYYARVKANPIAFRVKLHDIAHNMSEKRLQRLPIKDQDRLRKKYAYALEELRK